MTRGRAWSALLVGLVVAAQVGVLAWMAGEREWILHKGQLVRLRTAPIDPRDLFRGDFVRLDYDINYVASASITGLPPRDDRTPAPRRHQIVYTLLLPVADGLYEAAGTGTAQPSATPFIRGRIDDRGTNAWRTGTGRTFVKYGIEQFFVEQGQGKAIEDRRGARGELQVPMEVEVALSAGGTAVVRGYRWSKLGMRLEVLRRPPPRQPNAPPPDGPRSPRVRVTLANASEEPVAVADFGDLCAFHLVPVVPGEQPEAATPAACKTGAPTAADVRVLAPGQRHSVEIDLSDPRWYVLKDGRPAELGTLEGFAQYRIEYRAPPAGVLPEAAALWRGRMASQAFNAIGTID